MKAKFLGLTAIVAIVFFAMNGCEHKPKDLIKPGKTGNDTTVIIPNQPTNCDPDTVYFQNTILPIIVANCNGSGCHNAIDKKEGVVLDNYSNILKYIKPYKPNDGDLVERITTNSSKDIMPPSGKMDSKTIALIQKWISQGAKNNYCNEGCDSTKFAYAADLAPIITKNCGGSNNTCHFSGSASTLLGSYTDLKTIGGNQKLMGALNHTSGYQPMPSPTLKLSACDIKKFRKWIDAGYPQ